MQLLVSNTQFQQTYIKILKTGNGGEVKAFQTKYDA